MGTPWTGRRTCVEVVARAGAVEAVAEEVGEDLAGEALGRAPLVVDVRAQRGVLGDALDLAERVADREQDAVHLRVLVWARAAARERVVLRARKGDGGNVGAHQ